MSNTDELIDALRSSALPAPRLEELIARGLKHRNCFVRRVAVEALAATEAPGVVRRLTRVLSERCWEARVAALEGIQLHLAGRRRSPAAVLRALSDRDELVRIQAAEALGVIGEPRARVPLRRAINDRSPLVRRYVAEALGRVGTRADAALLLARLARERSASARLGLWHGAYLLGRTDALPGLLSMFASEPYSVRCALAVALEDTARHPADAQLVARALRRAIKSEHTVARHAMRTTLRILQSNRLEARLAVNS